MGLNYTDIGLIACWVKISADNILKYLSNFPRKEIGFDISSRLSPGDNLHEVPEPSFGREIRQILALHKFIWIFVVHVKIFIQAPSFGIKCIYDVM